MPRPSDTGLASDLANDIKFADAEIAAKVGEIEGLYNLAEEMVYEVMAHREWTVRMSAAHLRLKAGRP